MARRHVRSLTLLLLALLIAAPLSTGEKGLWLSLAASPTQLTEIVIGSVPAEDTFLVPERASRVIRAVTAPRPARVEATRVVGPTGSDWSLWSDWRWTIPETAPLHLQGAPLAARPAPRAPPA